MQTVSSDFTTATSAPAKKVIQGCLVAWDLTPNASTNWFTIGTSHIGGADLIKGAGGNITFFDKYQYADESSRVIDWQITQKLAQRPYGVIIATANITLDNTTKRYTPGYDPTIGDLILPNRPVKLSAGFGNESIMQFVGYTDRPKSPIVQRTTTIAAYDALNYLTNRKSALQTITNTSVSDIIVALLNEQGFSSTQYNIEPSLTQNISYINPNGQKVLDLLKELVEAECGLMFVDENGIIQFWNRQHMNNNRTSRWTFNYSNLTNLDFDNTPVINAVKVVAKPFKVMGKTLVWTNGQSLALQPGTTTDVFADFQDDNGAFPCTSVDTPLPVASATTSEYTTNYNSDGSGSDAAGVISLSSSYLFGNSYKMTFTNTSTQLVYITKLEVYGIPAKIQVLDTQEQDDTTSQDDYGINPNNNGDVLEIDNDLIQSSSDANAIAYIIVKQYGNPLFRMICPGFAVPQLQLGDAVTVHIDDTGVDKLCFIVGKVTTMQNNNFTVEYDVEERPTYDYFTIGSSHIGGSDYLAP